MKRSEKLENAIYQTKGDIEIHVENGVSEDGFILKHSRFILSILLAEQKRAEGCEPCNHDAIKLKMIELGFLYCPYCSRCLMDGESE